MFDLIQRIPPWAYIAIIAHLVVLGTVAYLILLERKIASWVQDRIGPNRVGLGFGIIPWLKDKHMFGLGQPLADGLKFILKEDYRPKSTDNVLFTLAPAVMIIVIIISIAVIPWGGWKGNVVQGVVPAGQTPAAALADDLPLHHQIVEVRQVGTDRVVELNPNAAVAQNTTVTVTHGWGFQIANLNVGVLFILAVLSLAVYGVVIGGWASNNKYSFLGGLRATAQMLAYEIPLGLSLLAVLLVVGSVMPEQIIRHQVENGWMIIAQPVAGALFFISALAEANRAPFDNAEAEQELVGGYHTEYSSMRFALFLLAEYCHVITSSAFFALLFLGGYHLPLIPWLNPEETTLLAVALKTLVYAGKVSLLVCFVMVVRWTLPRMRYDQVMMMAWQAVIPIALVVVVATSLVIYFGFGRSMGLAWGESIPLLAANLAIILGLLVLYPMLPRYNPNRKIRLYGSRFSPVPGEAVSTAPSDPMAIEDRPAASTAV
jgi:NADH-quinone oxidoreductase subunit H